MFGMKGLLEFHIPSRGAAIGAITEDDGGNSTTIRQQCSGSNLKRQWLRSGRGKCGPQRLWPAFRLPFVLLVASEECGPGSCIKYATKARRGV